MGVTLTRDEAVVLREELRTNGKTLVLTNGHFDLIHIGHLDYLEKARALGDALFVGVNADAITAHYKGSGRPLTPAAERARLLAALQPVSAVLIFDELTADHLIEVLQPDIYVKGGDYSLDISTRKPLPEADTAKRVGARVELIDYLPERSTSQLIARIKALP